MDRTGEISQGFDKLLRSAGQRQNLKCSAGQGNYERESTYC